MIGAIAAGVGLLQGGMKAFAPEDHSAYAANAYSNRLAENKARITNAQMERAGIKAKAATEEQIFENRDAASRAMAREQARMNEQLLGFSLGRQSLIRERILAQGQGNAIERYGRSAQRIRDLDIVGEYGRQNALFSENVASATRQSGRNMTDLARQRYEADRSAVAGLQAQLDGFMPVMAQTTYNPQDANNTALKIAGGLMTGLSAGLDTFGTLKGMKTNGFFG
jgi:hypothetical protein